MPGARRSLTLMELAQLVEDSHGSDELAKALTLLEVGSPACRRGMRKLHELTREVCHPDHTIAVAECRAAPGLWRELEQLAPAEQLAAIESDEQYQTWGLSRLLQRRSAELAGTDPESAARLAILAARIPRHLGEAYGEEHLQDLQGLAFCYLGNAWRELGELHSAGDAFDMARTLWQTKTGTGYSSVKVEALVLEALLRRDQRRLPAAVALLDSVIEIYASAPEDLSEPDLYDPERDAAARVHRSWCLYHMGQEQAAAAGLEAAAGLVVRKRPARLALAVRSGLLWCSVRLGLADVEARLTAAHQLADQVGDEADRLRLRRAEARIDLAAGDRELAELTLRKAAMGLLELDLGIDAALAHLDLAALYLDAGDVAAARQLGDQILPVFSSREVERNVIAALLLFLNACWHDRLTPGLLGELAALIERERRPSLAWWSAAKSMPLSRRTGDAGAAAPP